MTEGRVAGAAGSYLVQGRGTHDSAQDDLDAGHAGSVQEEEEAVYCVIVVILALRCDMRTAVCRGKAGRAREPASTIGLGRERVPRYAHHHTPAKLSPRHAVLCCVSHQRRSSNSRGASGSRGVPVHCMHRPPV